MRLRLWRQHRQLALCNSKGCGWLGCAMIGDGDCGRVVGGEIGMALSNGVKGDGVYSIDDVV